MGPPPWEMEITGARGMIVVFVVSRTAVRFEEKRKGESNGFVGGKVS